MAQAAHRMGWGQMPRRMIAAALAASTAMAAVAPVALTPVAAQAQNLFAPRIYVNGQVITEYEVMQRAEFMRVLGQAADAEKAALEALIEDKLRLAEAKRLGIKVTPEEIQNGMTEFAGRANLPLDQFLAELQKIGIGPETFRDFVTAGLLWRHAVRARFGGAGVAVTEAEVDRALEAQTRPRALKVQVSELVIVVEPGKEAEAMALAQRLSETISTEAEFAAAARQYSAAPTGQNGGRVPDWLSLSTLPGVIAQQLLALDKGDVTAPLEVPNAIVLFQLRDLARDEKAAPISVTVEWAEYLVPNDPAEIARIRASVDECNDLYGLAKGQPAELLKIQSAAASAVPGDVGMELAKLDLGEISTALTRGEYRRLVMLCSRKAVMENEPTRDQIKEQLSGQRIESMADNYLEELRAAAQIRIP